MIRTRDLLATTEGLDPDDLVRWIRDALVTPSQEAGEPLFTDPDRARVQLLCTLRYTLEIEEDTLPVVLSLIDQLYATRAQLRALAAAVAAQEVVVQQGIMSALTTGTGDLR